MRGARWVVLVMATSTVIAGCSSSGSPGPARTSAASSASSSAPDSASTSSGLPDADHYPACSSMVGKPTTSVIGTWKPNGLNVHCHIDAQGTVTPGEAWNCHTEKLITGTVTAGTTPGVVFFWYSLGTLPSEQRVYAGESRGVIKVLPHVTSTEWSEQYGQTIRHAAIQFAGPCST